MTPELKKAGNKLVYCYQIEKDAYDLPDYEQVMKICMASSLQDVIAG